MASSTTGFGPDKGRLGWVSYYVKNGSFIARLARNRRRKKGAEMIQKFCRFEQILHLEINYQTKF